MPLKDNINAYYKLENGAFTNDSLGTYNLTNTNSVSNTASGKIGFGADFGTANTNKVLESTTTLGLTSTSAFTFSLWVKMNTEISAGTQTFIGVSQQGTNWSQFRIEYEFNAGSRRMLMGVNGGGGYVTVNNTITLGTTNFNHFVLTYTGGTGGTITGYINGSSVGTATATISGSTAFTNVTQIGALTNNFYASAIIDEVGVWSRAITSGEVTQLYNSGLGITYPFANNSNFFIFM